MCKKFEFLGASHCNSHHTTPQLEAFRSLLERLPGRVDLKRPELLLTMLEDGDASQQGEVLHKVGG